MMILLVTPYPQNLPVFLDFPPPPPSVLPGAPLVWCCDGFQGDFGNVGLSFQLCTNSPGIFFFCLSLPFCTDVLCAQVRRPFLFFFFFNPLVIHAIIFCLVEVSILFFHFQVSSPFWVECLIHVRWPCRVFRFVTQHPPCDVASFPFSQNAPFFFSHPVFLSWNFGFWFFF